MRLQPLFTPCPGRLPFPCPSPAPGPRAPAPRPLSLGPKGHSALLSPSPPSHQSSRRPVPRRATPDAVR